MFADATEWLSDREMLMELDVGQLAGIIDLSAVRADVDLAEVQRLSVQAHLCLGCQVFSRVDWRIDRETMKPYVLEVNTIPGFTSHSLLPKAALRAGVDFAALCQRIIELSLRRNRRQGALRRQERVA